MHEAHAVLASLGIDMKRPLVTQVSRFDSWKNPWQAVDAYRLAKRVVPEVQLALVGTFAADDDPEAPAIYEAIREYAGGDPDVHLFADPGRVGARVCVPQRTLDNRDQACRGSRIGRSEQCDVMPETHKLFGQCADHALGTP